MDTIIFGILAVAAILIIRGKTDRLAITVWAVSCVAILGLFLVHTTSQLQLSF